MPPRARTTGRTGSLRLLACLLALLGTGCAGRTAAPSSPTSSQAGATERPYLRAALEIADWLDTVAVRQDVGVAWPAQIEGEPAFDRGLYAGVPGVVLFYLEAHRATGDARLIARAEDAADWLASGLAGPKELEPGLYGEYGGLTLAFLETWRASGNARHRDAARRVIERILDQAAATESGVTWGPATGVTDIIGGSAGIGLLLLAVAEPLEMPDALMLARGAGDHLLSLGIPEHGGTKWAMTPSFERRMPNFSHGTAGIGYFLVRLYERTGDERYLEGARAGGRYLRAIASDTTPRDGAGDEPAEGPLLILHSEPGREDLFYLGWCHGPPGTLRFLHALADTTAGDATESESWARFARRLAHGLHASGLPARTPGFWNNAGVCCGDAGVADALLAVAARNPDEPASNANRALAHALLADALARSTVDERGRRWTHAEHRVRPELLTTQTGLMQGAAGIGLVLLRADARAAGRPPAIVFPDSPW